MPSELFAQTDRQEAATDAIVAVELSEIMAFTDWVRHPQEIVLASVAKAPLHAPFPIAECFSRGEYLERQFIYFKEAKRTLHTRSMAGSGIWSLQPLAVLNPSSQRGSSGSTKAGKSNHE